MGFALRVSDKEIAARGGLSVMNWMLDPLGFDAALKKADFPQPIRTGGERPAQLITPFLLSVWGRPSI